jgi:hypothetical protein
VHRLLALTDLFELGRHDAQGPPGVPQVWSTEAMTRSGCACLAPASVPGVLERGRPASGILGSVLGDVGLRLAEVSLEMKLPPGLARALLAGAVYDFAFDAAPLHEDDWLGLARGVDAITRDRIEVCRAVDVR